MNGASDRRIGDDRRPARRRCLLLAVGMVTAGCGRDSGAPPIVKVYEVTGKVVLADGKPLRGGRVYFVPEDGLMTPEGKVGPDGTFVLNTGPSGEGAPPGGYKVRIEPEDTSLMTARRVAARGKRLPFPPKYLDEDSSGLTAVVRAESNRLEPFRLK